eukprot:591467-Alexandrium_andersonii.AAC.1
MQPPAMPPTQTVQMPATPPPAHAPCVAQAPILTPGMPVGTPTVQNIDTLPRQLGFPVLGPTMPS